MRTTTALSSLLAAAASVPIVLAAPLPSGIVAERESRLAATLDELSGSSVVVIDNSHYTPSNAIPPSAVLATPRPIETTYLMGLAPTKARATTATADAAQKEATIPIRIHNTDDNVEIVLVDTDANINDAAKYTKATTTKLEMEPIAGPEQEVGELGIFSTIELPESLRMEAKFRHKIQATDTPCYYAQLRRDYNDMMVISLVAVFLLVIVAVELWDSSEESIDVQVTSMGAIKLDDDPVHEKGPLSIQALSEPDLCLSELEVTSTV